jgi:hypothetical protein
MNTTGENLIKYIIDPSPLYINLRGDMYEVNECTIRNLQIAIKKGELIPEDFEAYQLNDHGEMEQIIFRNDGFIKSNVPAMCLNTKLALDLF